MQSTLLFTVAVYTVNNVLVGSNAPFFLYNSTVGMNRDLYHVVQVKYTLGFGVNCEW